MEEDKPPLGFDFNRLRPVSLIPRKIFFDLLNGQKNRLDCGSRIWVFVFFLYCLSSVLCSSTVHLY